MSLPARPNLNQRIAAILSPPFRGWATVIWVYFAACFLLNTDSQIWRSGFVDSDDYLYMTQAIDQLQGQSWYDLVQKRMNPPVGTFIHFSHLLSALYAIPVLIMKPWFGMLNAATVTAAVFPLLFFAVFLRVARSSASKLVDPAWAGLTAFVALFSLSLMLQFTPGRVDHHGLEGLFAILSFGLLARMVAAPLALRAAMGAGIVLALALTIGLEILPVLFVLTVWLGLWAIVKGRAEARAAFVFGLTLCIGSVIFLALTRSPESFFDLSLDSFSLTYVILTACIAASFGVLYLVNCQIPNIPVRFVVNGVFVFLVGAVFFAFFPNFGQGPYGGVNPVVAKLILNRSTEAWPLMRGGPYWRSVALPVLGILACAHMISRQDGMKRWSAGLLMALIIMSFGLAIFYQQRMMVFAEAFAVLALPYAAQKLWNMADGVSDRLMVGCGKVFALAVVGPLPVIIIPLLIGAFPADNNALVFPVQITQKICDHSNLIPVLNERYGDRPRLIMNALADSAELLYRTQHAILAAPFHKNTDGNLDAYAFFSSTDPASAELIARRRGVELVVLCRSLDAVYTENSANSDVPKTLARQLVDGQIPSWLKPVKVPEPSNVLLFELSNGGEL